MSFVNSRRMTRFALIALLAAGLLIRFVVRPPAEAAPGSVVSGIDLVGQVRGLVDEVAHNAQQLAALDNEAPFEEIAKRRNALEADVPAFGRLKARIDDTQSSWVSLGRAEILLEDAETVAAEALRLSPSQPVSPDDAAGAGATETDPNKTGVTPKTVSIIESRVAALLTASDDLRGHVYQVAVDASETQATLFGFRVADLLTSFLVLSTIIALLTLHQAEVRLRAPPEKTLKTQLQLRARSDGRGAIQRCYELSTELLELADRLLRQTRQAEETSQ